MAGGGNEAGRKLAPWVLQVAGICLIVASFINSEVLGRTFHGEFIIGGLGLCGAGIAHYLDRK